MLRAALVTVVICGVLSGFVARAAWAADPAEVEALIRQGVELRRVGKDPAAVPYFQKAYDLERSPRTAAQLGLVEAALGYWLASEKHLQEAVASPRHPWLVQHLGEITGTLDQVRSHISELDLVGGPVGAEVVVNGKVAGTLPLSAPLRVAEGPVEVRLRAPGYAEGSATAIAQGGGSQRMTLTLVAAPGNPVQPAGPGAMAAGSAGPPARDDSSPSPPADLSADRSSSAAPVWVRPAAWTTAALAVAASALGVYGLADQHEQRGLFERYERPATTPGAATERPCGSALADRGGGWCRTYYDRAKSAGRLAVVGFVAAGVLATAAVVGFVLSADRNAEARFGAGGTPTVAIGAGQATLGWSVRF